MALLVGGISSSPVTTNPYSSLTINVQVIVLPQILACLCKCWQAATLLLQVARTLCVSLAPPSSSKSNVHCN